MFYVQCVAVNSISPNQLACCSGNIDVDGTCLPVIGRHKLSMTRQRLLIHKISLITGALPNLAEWMQLRLVHYMRLAHQV